MRNNWKTMSLASLFAPLLLLTVPNENGYCATAKPITFKLAHNQAENHPVNLGAAKFAELVKERTGGRVMIDVFPANVLGPESATRDMIKDGTLSMVAMGGPSLSPYGGAVDLTSMLYGFRSEDEMLAVLEGDFGQKWFYKAFIKDHGVRVLDQWPMLPRVTMSKKEFQAITDLKGVKIRVVSGIPVWERSWSALGAMTVALSLDECFSGIQQGVADAVEGPLDQHFFFSFQEVTKYLVRTNHNYYTQMILINESVYQKLSPEDQKILEQSAKDAGKLFYSERNRLAEEIQQKMVKDFGIKVIDQTDEEIKGFMDAVQPLYEQLMNMWGKECLEDFTAAIKAYRDSKK